LFHVIPAIQPQIRNFPTENGKTQADAEKACKDAFNKNTILRQCTTYIGFDFGIQIDECVEDFKVRKITNECWSTTLNTVFRYIPDKAPK
jgi:hypothetical protein